MDEHQATSNNFYNVAHWGEGYFQVNDSGNMEICKSPRSKGIELKKIVEEAQNMGLHLPLLIRCSDILHHRVKRINDAFQHAISEVDYQGSYRLVYPVKVNQQQSVSRELLKTPDYTIGLEAGSKPELMAVLGMLGNKVSTIICNGYKDNAYIRCALIAQQMGHEVFIVIEKRSELATILSESKKLGLVPKLGVRIRLVSKSAGKWENSGGAKSKFGLNAKEVLELIQQLKDQKILESLQLMHCHLGSQIANIQDIRNCMQEVARYYVELRQLNAPVSTVDVGGGLSVDYEGTRSSQGCSMNYSIEEYATHIMLALKPLCQEANIPEPNLISESGRALTAHHAVVIADISGIEQTEMTPMLPGVRDNDFRVIHDIYDTYHSISEGSPIEIHNYAEHSLNEAHALFKHGVINLKEKAKVEAFYTNICMELRDKLYEKNPNEMDLLAKIDEKLAAKVFCNLSFFQSIPDAWAIKQIFPIAPISQLNTTEFNSCILQDLTCDSDGTIKEYLGSSKVNTTISLPRYDSQNPYALGIFLVGAYQEILGNLHNLFGDTNSLDVKLFDDGTFELHDLVTGDTITNVLNLAHYDVKKLLQSYEKQLIQAKLSREETTRYLNELRSIFSQSTYLEDQTLELL